ncbi:MAG: tetratricopeptide repeat protein, partial [Acidobacteriota bacterium]
MGLLACHTGEPALEQASVQQEPALQRRSVGEVPERGDAVLEPGEFHEYELGHLASAEGVHLVLEQQGVDLVAQVVGEDDAILLSVDLPIGAFGFEHVCFAAREAGHYRLRVGPWSAEDSGPYQIRRRDQSVPSQHDPPEDPEAAERIAHCEAGLRALVEAEAHQDRASPAVAELYGEAITRWRRVGADFPLAVALKQAGWHSFQRGRLETAVARFEEALALLRHVSEESIQT